MKVRILSADELKGKPVINDEMIKKYAEKIKNMTQRYEYIWQCEDGWFWHVSCFVRIEISKFHMKEIDI